MTNTTKITKAMALNAILTILDAVNSDTVIGSVALADMVAYCDNELELLAKKKSSTSKEAKANAETRMALSEIVLATLVETGKPMTVSEMQTANEELRVAADGTPISNQRITSVCHSLVENSQIINTKDKKKSYFSIA